MPQNLHLQSATRPPDADEPDVINIHLYPSKKREQEPTDARSDESPDWTVVLPDTAHVCFFRGRDWARTPLGPLRAWSRTLRLYTRMMFADSRAACLWW
jgi:hypothetical protein